MDFFIARIEDSALYEKLHPCFKAAFEFLRRADLADLPEGRYPLAENDECFAVIESPVLRLPGEAKCEAHKKYIDIHAPLAEEEYIGIGKTPESVVEEGFTDDRDIAFFDASVKYEKVEKGSFAVVPAPWTAHIPAVTFSEKVPHKKVIIKVLAH